MRFIDNGDGTVTDVKTGLMWQKATAPETYDWHKGNEYCSKLKLGGYNDWRLPSAKELQSIVDHKRYGPATNPVFETVSLCYWSSSTHTGNPWYAWYVDFEDEGIYGGGKTVGYHIRAVRNIT